METDNGLQAEPLHLPLFSLFVSHTPQCVHALRTRKEVNAGLGLLFNLRCVLVPLFVHSLKSC